MNVLDRYYNYIRTLNTNTSHLSCKITNEGLYLPNSDEFYVTVKSLDNGNMKGIYLHSNKVKKYVSCIASLREQTTGYYQRSNSGFELLGFRFENGCLYLYVHNYSSFVANRRRRIFRFGFSLQDSNSAPIFNPSLIKDVSGYDNNYDTCVQDFISNVSFIGTYR